jgi:hypothetical protein
MKERANSEDNNFSTVDASGNADDDSVKVNSDGGWTEHVADHGQHTLDSPDA